MKTDINSKHVAIVTGAAKGIGRAIALNLAVKGIIPIIVDIDEDAGRNVLTPDFNTPLKNCCKSL